MARSQSKAPSSLPQVVSEVDCWSLRFPACQPWYRVYWVASGVDQRQVVAY
jgi:hypothetical protein